ncbi:type II toxin-antitoxin system HipA family toxin [Burkholderia alba]|uniref:type II toxin-antitoxin system HipA family toxin n=1 Tax=Burkholderia alba TaxID=2683677 RepID=UPI002B05C9A4|nr:type II toxin-antitoxin system HipA family toxin [Burkholderia alba]
MIRPDQLHVFLGAERIGSIHDTSPVAFEYAPAWLARADAFALAAIPLAPGRHDDTATQAFFENLLPEGELRSYLTQQRKASTLFAMLHEIAGDTAGAFVILPAGQVPDTPHYDVTSWEALARVLAETTAVAIDIHGDDARISLAGAQDKTSIAIFADGIPRLPRGIAPSTHIIKPDIKRIPKIWHSAANETIVMRTAANCGLPTAEVFYEPHTQACIVRRFDRTLRQDGTLARLIQYDLCQLNGTLSERKYEAEGGPGIAACAALIRRHSTQPAVDLRHFVDWILFNLYVGNNDSHAKNLSIYTVPGRGVMLTPFYDLLCTRLYPGLSKSFAFSVGGATLPGKIGRDQIVAMAEQLGMRPQFVLREAADLARKIPAALDAAIDSIRPVLPIGAHPLAEQLRHFILSTTAKTAARLAA